MVRRRVTMNAAQKALFEAVSRSEPFPREIEALAGELMAPSCLLRALPRRLAV